MKFRRSVFLTAFLLAAAQLPLGAAAQARADAGPPDASSSRWQATRATLEARPHYADATAWYFAAGAPQRHLRIAYGDIDREVVDAKPTPAAHSATASTWAEAKSAVSAAEADARKAGHALARDGDRAEKDVVKGFDSLRAELQAPPRSGGSKVSPFDVGA
jgi:hypothetical protein